MFYIAIPNIHALFCCVYFMQNLPCNKRTTVATISRLSLRITMIKAAKFMVCLYFYYKQKHLLVINKSLFNKINTILQYCIIYFPLNINKISKGNCHQAFCSEVTLRKVSSVDTPILRYTNFSPHIQFAPLFSETFRPPPPPPPNSYL